MTFYDRMWIVCLSIPKGTVATYGQIAMLCGMPKNSRLVGYGLRENLAGNDIPAFRIVNSKGGTQRCGALSCPGFTAHSACGGRYPYRLEWKVPACKPEAIRMENNAEGCRTLRKKFFPSGRDLPGTITRTDCRFKAPFRSLAQRNGTYRYAPAPAV